jgi:hypothetical protein
MRQSWPKLGCCDTKTIVPCFSDAAKSSTSQYSVESTVTSRVANVLCFFYNVLLGLLISVLTCFHIVIMRMHVSCLSI